ncbi:transmembrane protein 132D [Conger conger]|uniref:transmembrane protein 132D n=1 Tax=Conger conger TaxID=82655 RepID=UPI002A5B0E29|nr:transmembrane protein 132D [Conger conger]
MWLDSVEPREGAQGDPAAPLPLPLNYRVLYAESLFLTEAGGEEQPNSTLPSPRQALVLLRSGPNPAVSVGYGPLSAEAPVPPELVLARRLRPLVLARRVLSTVPMVRVLFYAAERRGPGARGGAQEEEEELCVTLYGVAGAQETRGGCSLPGGAGLCLAELEPAPAWFRPLGGASSRERQDQKEGGAGVLELYYRARPIGPRGRCTPEDSPVGGAKAGDAPEGRAKAGDAPTAAPRKRIGSVRLLKVPPGPAPLSRLRLGGGVVVQTSPNAVKNTEPATFIVSVSSASPLTRFTLRATVKKGLSFSTARPRNAHLWGSTLEPGTDGQLGTVSITCQRKSPGPGKSGLLELLLLDFVTEEPSGQSEMHEVTWQLELPGGQRRGEQGIMGIYTTPKDYVGLAPLIVDTELLNTAVLSGKRVSMAVRTVAVAVDGSVTDVSNFTQCRSTDEDVLKVSERCDYVFVNGKETRGRVRVAVNFTYGPLSSQLEMSVWAPRLPLQIEVSDPELSQIKGWRVPVPAGKRSSRESEEEEDEKKGRGCMLQFQHALLKVFTPFLAEQPNTRLPPARFLGADWRVDVTRLVRYSLKVENPRVARVQGGRVLLGRAVGVTSVKVLSPLSDAVLGERTVKVLDDRVSITELGVQLVSSLSLSLQLSPGSNRAIVATATTQELLHNPKQEAVVGCWVRFSDGSLAPLDVYDPSSYALTVRSLDEGVASVRGSPAMVVAEGEGQGPLLRVELGIGGACQKSKRKSSLATARGSLRVAFRPSGLYNGREEEAAVELRTPPALAGRGRTEEGRRYGTSSVSESVSLTTLSQDDSTVSTGLGGVRASTIQAATGVGGVGSNMGGASNYVGGGNRTEGGAISVLGGVSSPVYDGGLVTVDDSDVPSQVEVPRRTPAAEVETNMVQEASRFPSNLEIGMYALLGVLCLAILVFLLNCISYLTAPRHKKPPAHCQESGGHHRHNWVWLGTEADRALGGPVTPPPPESHTAIAISIDVPSTGVGMVAMGRSATLGRRTSAPPSSDPPLGRRGSLQARPARADSLHSPTSKRKRVQFTTFSSLDGPHYSTLPGDVPHYSTLPGMHWAAKVQEFTSQQGSLQEALYANLSYEHKPMQ